LIILVIRLRHYGSQLIIGDDTDASSLRLGLARVWWMISIAYVLAIWFLSIGKRAATGESSMIPGIGSLLLFAFIPFFDRGLQFLVSWYFRDKPAPQDSAEADEIDSLADEIDSLADDEEVVDLISSEADTISAPGYVATSLRYARTIMALVILFIFVRLWNINLEAISAQLIGQTFANALFDIGITVLLTWAMWGMIRISIERKLSEGKSDSPEEGESEAGGLGGSRVETVLPLIRVSIKITLIIMAVLISLSSLGVNIGPLIAGAGVLGIAIGFGAQTLVRDIVSGFFYLLDDAFRIGEYVVIDQIRGSVEKISLRSFQLRHHEGPVHTIPYGEIRTLTNWSRDWAIMKFELRIPFETDIEMVRKMIKQIGIDMTEDPVFGPLMLAPLKSQGVNRIDDSALIIRCKFTAIPGQQYLIRREAFTRIQRVFEEKGIQFAPRRVLVEATTPAEAINAAAASIDQEKPADPSKPPPM
jgi:small-conductance mechanosensitive channel